MYKDRKQLGMRMEILFILFFWCLFSFPVPIRAVESGLLHLAIVFNGNLILDKYDIELFLDDTQVATLPHGEDLETNLSAAVGEHTLTFYKADDHGVSEILPVTISEEASLSCKIAVSKKRIRISKVEFKDLAAEKAEEARIAESIKASEEASRAEEESKKAKEEELAAASKDFKELLSVKTGTDPLIPEFAAGHVGSQVQFMANVAWISGKDNNLSVLIHSGQYADDPVLGPDILLTGSRKGLAPYNRKGGLETGMSIELTAKVAGYRKETGLLLLDFVECRYFSGGTASIGETGYTSPGTIRKVQEALNLAGFSCGSADGIAGKKTSRAISEYRESRGIGNSSEIDGELLAYLRVKADAPEETAQASVKREIIPQKESEKATERAEKEAEPEYDYILNTNTKKFHYPNCSSVNQMKEKNKL